MPRTDARAPGLFRVYCRATAMLAPLAYRSVARKLRAHDVPEARIAERMGHATEPEPGGPLIWFHAASVGESLSVLTLIARMGDRLPQAQFLITSGTATSAQLIARRMPPRPRHQFAPLDAPGPVGRFLSHWRPRAAVFVESELWPLMLARTRDSGARLALVNARLSAKSVDGWRRFPDTARFVLGCFSLLLTQNDTARRDLLAMGADPDRVHMGGNLKSTSDPLPVDEETLAAMQTALSDRPLWIAASTHPGEEEQVLAAHARVLERHPDACLILAPRHPERSAEVAALIERARMTQARRSVGDTPDGASQVYLADTLGELGTWYALAPIVFLGGSLREIGGHNPFEPASAGAAILTGPHVTNFAETFAPLIATGGAVEVADPDDLAAAGLRWLGNPAPLATARTAARDFATKRQEALSDIVDRLCTALDLG